MSFEIKFLPWYQNKNLSAEVSKYLDVHSITKLVQGNKQFKATFDTDIIWWTMYNNSFKQVRVIDNILQGQSEENKLGSGRRAYLSALKACIDKDQLAFKCEECNRFNACVMGFLGELPQSQSIAMTYGANHDLLSFFN